jgi:hypothetical protein
VKSDLARAYAETQAVPTEARHRQRQPGKLERRREQILEEQVGTMEEWSEETRQRSPSEPRVSAGFLE